MVSPNTRDSLWQFVRTRARNRCEYCHLAQSVAEEQFHIDHIRSRKHAGQTTADNLALACSRCNLHKGTNPAGYDSHSDILIRLFNPRTDHWPEHFSWNGPSLVGLTEIGRATVVTLQMNHADRVALRQIMINAGLISPDSER